jgi:hypothetical protein
MCGLQTDIGDIKKMLRNLNKKLDRLLDERETLAAMALSEYSLQSFLEREPDIYSPKDIKVKYRLKAK